MNRDEVIALAREAGARNMEPYDYGAKPDRMIVYHEDLERFAALVAKREREECAKVCDDFDVCDPKHIANAIRSRA